MTQLSTSEIPEGFTEKTVRVNGVTLNYAFGGTGPAVVLMHGYPQSWYMWRKVMPALAEQYTVIAPDTSCRRRSAMPTRSAWSGTTSGAPCRMPYTAAHRDAVRRLTVVEASQIDESLYQSRR
jgi:pimeloyl-ACP methyl ester carboxylesterase